MAVAVSRVTLHHFQLKMSRILAMMLSTMMITKAVFVSHLAYKLPVQADGAAAGNGAVFYFVL